MIVTSSKPVNALDSQGWFDFAAAVKAMGERGDVHCVVVRAEGKGFQAGVDIKELAADGTKIVGLGWEGCKGRAFVWDAIGQRGSLYDQGRNRDRVAEPITLERAGQIKADRMARDPNNVLADRDGNIYQRLPGGNWNSREEGVWKPTVPETRPGGVGPTIPSTRPAIPESRPQTRPAIPETRPTPRPAQPGARPTPTPTPSTRPATRPVPRDVQRDYQARSRASQRPGAMPRATRRPARVTK